MMLQNAGAAPLMKRTIDDGNNLSSAPQPLLGGRTTITWGGSLGTPAKARFVSGVASSSS